MRDRWCAWRDRLLADRRFQRWAARFPLTRPIARRRAAGLFDLVAGFVYSQVLLACVRLRLFEVLAEGPQTLAELASRLQLPEDGAHRLLAAAVSLDLVQRRSGGRYGLGPLGAPLVGDTAIAAMVEHHAALYADLRDPVALLRGNSEATALSRYWPYAGDQPGALTNERAAEYSALMSASQPLVAEQVLAAYPLARHRCLLDVGGGEGTFLKAVAAHTPDLRLMMFDLPPVAERARAQLAEAGLAPRATAFGGSFFDDPLPTGADIVTLVRVLFDHSDARALAILQAARRALPPGGTLLVAEPMAGTPGAEAMGDAYFGFYLLAMGKGRSRSAADLTQLLRSAGFVQARLLPTPMPLQTQVLVAHAPPA
ncbi:MAG: methyltransferase [Methylibium sp. NZG]|nr:MAG: methyltransferase [Methylibium sp. NZG]